MTALTIALSDDAKTAIKRPAGPFWIGFDPAADFDGEVWLALHNDIPQQADN